MKKIISDNFEEGSWVYLYYRYMATFHTEPEDWNNFFEFLSYTNTEAKVLAFKQVLNKDK